MKRKRCSKCGRTRNIDAFAWKIKAKGTRQAWCRDCQKVYSRRYYSEHRKECIARAAVNNKVMKERAMAWVMNYLSSHPCVDCGESDPLLLDFDHVSGEKKFSVSNAINRQKAGVQKIAKEVEKCVVRCSNCHRRKTATTNGFWKTRWGEIKPKPYKRNCEGRDTMDRDGIKLKRKKR